MRVLKIMVITLILGGLAVPLLSCGSESEEAELLENQVVAVQRGDLTVDITAVGNLALSRTEDLAFEISGTVEEILVEEGESVEEEQVLVKLDTSEWEEQLEALEDQLITAERQLTAKERDLLQAEVNLKNAEISLAKANNTYEWPDPDYETALESAQADVDDAEKCLKYAKKYQRDTHLAIWSAMVDWAQEYLRIAESRLQALENESEDDVAINEVQVELAQGKLEDAQTALGDAQKDIDDAQKELDEARSDSPVITAPFDGFITMVNVEGGDEVLTGTVAVQLADPSKFEADILVSEMDIFQVKLGGDATVQVDAMPVVSLPAKVTHISPTATIQSGVVNYEVKVEVESLEAVMQERQGAGRKPAKGQVMEVLLEDFQLREGLTVTVSIIVDERSGVLLVPNSAITTQGGQTYVQVLSPDGTIEQRLIQTGISNWQYTEVTDGLSEGEQVIVPLGTTTTPTTEQGPPGGMMIPGMGGPR